MHVSFYSTNTCLLTDALVSKACKRMEEQNCVKFLAFMQEIAYSISYAWIIKLFFIEPVKILIIRGELYG